MIQLRFCSPLLLLAVLAVGCEPASSPAPTFTVRDSAGIEIVENLSPAWPDGSGWSIDSVPVAQIGQVEGGDPYLFARIGDAKMMGDATVAVLESNTREIRIFDLNGSYLATAGRRGEGPGEFLSPPLFIPTTADTILTWDHRQARMQWFLTDGTFLRDESLPPALRGPVGWDLTKEGDLVQRDLVRTLNGNPTSALDESTGLQESWVVFHLFDARGQEKGEVPDTFPWNQFSQRGRSSVAQPFFRSTRSVLLGAPVRLFVNNPGSWQVSAYGPNGNLQTVIRAAIPRRQVTRAMFNRERDYRFEDRLRRGLSITSDSRVAWENHSLPDSTPAIEELYWDGDGHLWVLRWAWERAEDLGPPVYDVIRLGDHQWLGSVEVPREWGEVLSVSPDYVLTRWRNEFDVQFVRIYSLDRGG